MAEVMQLIHGDCLEVMRGMEAESVDAIVTDPPYGLSFMGKKWDYDVPSVEVWRECLRLLKPGGHLLAFAGTRTQHRMACNIEDAGFEIRDMIAWVYGSGFPKSLDVSKAIDKAAGAEREVVGMKQGVRGADGTGHESAMPGKATGIKQVRCDVAITAPATDAAKQWAGWGTALKPAMEPITVARKPFDGTVAENVLRHGTGAINVDGCRVGTTVETRPATRSWTASRGPKPRGAHGSGDGETISAGDAPPGRFPANIIHDGSEQVVSLFPQSVSSATGSAGGTGSAARFFYCAKASKRDRDEGCEELEERTKKVPVIQTVGVGLHGQSEDGKQIALARNNHPTVKPTDLMKYLVRLVCPPNGIVLDPFMGSGSTGKACALEGFRFIGIEREAEYIEIAERRIMACQTSSR